MDSDMWQWVEGWYRQCLVLHFKKQCFHCGNVNLPCSLEQWKSLSIDGRIFNWSLYSNVMLKSFCNRCILLLSLIHVDILSLVPLPAILLCQCHSVVYIAGTDLFKILLILKLTKGFGFFFVKLLQFHASANPLFCILLCESVWIFIAFWTNAPEKFSISHFIHILVTLIPATNIVFSRKVIETLREAFYYAIYWWIKML